MDDDDYDARLDGTDETDLEVAIIDRNHEQAALNRLLSQPGPRNIHVHGPRGTGKTWITNAVLNQLPDAYQVCRVSCLEHDSQYKALKALHYQLTGDEISSGHHTSELKHRIEEHLTETTVILFDELDFLLENDGNDLLYYLSRVEDNQNLNLIGISANYSSLQPVIDDRTYSSLHPETIEFTPYTATQARRILTRYDDDALADIPITPQVYDRIVTNTRNIRLGLHWLQYAADAADETVKPNLVDDVRHSAVQLYWDVLLKDFSTHHHLLLEAVQQLTDEQQEAVYTGDIYDRYTDLTQISDEDPLSQRRVSDFLNHLELLGIIQAEYFRGGEQGKTREIHLNSPLNQPKDIDVS